jgi:hypothetical protein
MSVTLRPYVDGGWEVDIRVCLPDGTLIRERRKAPTASKSAAQRWAEARERVLLVHGKPDRPKEVLRPPTTLREFAPRFLEGYAKANRLKASGVASKECALRIHLVPTLGDKPLAQITTEDVQQLKSTLGTKSPKTVNNVLTVLNVLMRTAVEWDVIERVPCAIKIREGQRRRVSRRDCLGRARAEGRRPQRRRPAHAQRRRGADVQSAQLRVTYGVAVTPGRVPAAGR